MKTTFLVAFVLVECWYWFVYFPRAWRDGSNREINDIKHACSADAGAAK